MSIRPRYLFAILFVCFLVAAVVGCQQQTPPGRERTAAARHCPQPSPVYAAPAPVATPAWLPVAGRTVILDPGHGGKDEGTSHFGLREKDINLDLGLRTAQLLQSKGVVVHMTRQTDAFVTLADRSAFANRYPDAILVSIHVNASAKNPNAAGVETFILTKDIPDADRGQIAAKKFRMNGLDSDYGRQALASMAARSRARGPILAASVQKSMTARLGTPDRGVKTGNLAVLRETYLCPAILVEVGFLTHAPTAASMKTPEWRAKTADALAEGIAGFLRQPESAP